MKKYLLLIPTMFVMLLNVIGCGQVVFNASAAVDYSEYFQHEVSEVNELFNFDFTDFDAICSADERYLPAYYGTEYYFYSISCDPNVYDNYINGSVDLKSVFTFTLFALKDLSYEENDYCIRFRPKIYSTRFLTDDSSAVDYPFGTEEQSSYYVYYYKNTGSFSIVSAYSSNVRPEAENFCDGRYYFYQSTNIPDFPFPDFVNHGSSSNKLNVDVSFEPPLTGKFDRRVVERGRTITLENFKFRVTNNSKFSIQYAFFIVKRDEEFNISPDKSFDSPNGKVYSGNPAYAYVTDEWCYLPKHDGTGKGGIVSTFTPSTWHYLSSGDEDSVDISFSQMLLKEYTPYDLYVYAVRNDKDSVCVIPFNQSSFQQGYNEEYMIDFLKAEIVYSSTFSVLNPAEFNPSLNDNGSYAFDPDDKTLFNRASAYKDDNGEVVIKKVDTDKFISSPDSWGSEYDSDAWDKYYKSQNTVSSDINQLSLNFSSFFRFVNTVFSYFPKNFQSVFVLGLTGCVVVGILKVVF